MDNQKYAIRCQGIKKSYGKGETRVDVLDGVDMDVEHGKLTLLVGPSGSGKTTLLSIITTILTPDAGQLFLLDHEVSSMTDDERSQFCLKNIGTVFQSLFLVPTLTVGENVSLPLLVAGFSEIEANEKAKEILAKMKLEHKIDISPAFLSKGQQQRVAIARAMVNESKILICDEPTSSLDHASGLNIMGLLRELAVKFSKAVLVVTHDQRTFSFADRILELNDGKIIPGGKNE